MLPMLWHHLNTAPAAPEVPDDVADLLRQSARDSTARNLQLGIELGRALDLLERESVPVMLLKGAALVDEAYQHPGLRPMGDLDLLVPRADLERAHEALGALGYAVRGRPRLRDEAAWVASMHHHLPLVRAGGSVTVELHYRLFVDPAGIDHDALWARAVPSALHPPHLLPAPEDLLLHVAVHFVLDRTRRGPSALRQVADLVRISRRWDLDWGVLVDRAREAQVADRLFLALNTAALLVAGVAPPDVLAELAPRSYTPKRGELFVRQRVLPIGRSLPLDHVAGGPRRILVGRNGLEAYLSPDDVEVPSLARLHARRTRALARRLVREAAHPRDLARDIRLSRWIVSLRS